MELLDQDLIRRLTETIRRRSSVLLITLVLSLSIGAVTLGAASIHRSIYAPFAVRPAATGEGEGAALIPDLGKDTDGDGLTDADELNAYGTSPYLADSDSDGPSDGEEVRAATDPNCPEGKTCGREASAPPAAPGPLPGLRPAGTPSSAELRGILKQAGLPAAEVDALSDAEVLRVYGEARARVEGSTSASGAPPAAPAPPTPAELRALLLKSGVPEDQLNAVSDADLLKLYEETATTGAAPAPPSR